ncbi:MAG: ABC transporter ATP-binding protein [Magnetococcales bacterium]|nr:ABC transporter ATP-binding protein [Magnetococcales bacterium]
MSNTSILVAKGLKKIFKAPQEELEVLKGIDLTLHAGEMVALLGVSGAGKSTLIQILGGLDRPSEGTVEINGQNLYSVSERVRARLRNQHIGFVYQYHRLLPEFNALENVMMPLLIGRKALKEARSRAEAGLEEVGLTHRLTHKPGQLSGGEQQRVALARALVSNPKLLLADEPTGNLDHHTTMTVFDLLRDIGHRRQMTCLMVTHNPELANASDRKIYLDDGMLAVGLD